MVLTGRVCCVCLVVAVLSPALPEREVAEQSSSICDDGKYMNEEDMDGPESWECLGQPFQITAFLEPSAHEECSTVTEEAFPRCMDTAIEYSDHPPSSGNYRPLRPKYGDYRYLPPQRWLNALKFGAVAFLYHPCAPRDQVLQLKQVAKSCLWRHIISPYPHLTREEPLALVSWGCVLRAKWVEQAVLMDWITEHALHTQEALQITTNGAYDEGLVVNATRVEVDGKEVVCPTHHTVTGPPSHSTHNTVTDSPSHSTSTGQPSTNTSSDEKESPSQDTPLTDDSTCSTPPTPTLTTCPPPHTPTLHHPSLHHHAGYIMLVVAASIVLLGVTAVFTWRLCSTPRGSKRRAKYKAVSKFIPFSYGQQHDSNGGIAIPELGLPKSGQAEREMLLNESDEDEI